MFNAFDTSAPVDTALCANDSSGDHRNSISSSLRFHCRQHHGLNTGLPCTENPHFINLQQRLYIENGH